MKPTKYTQQWSEYNKAQTREKALFTKLLHDLCQTIEEPEHKFGRPKLSKSDMVFCAVFKVYSLYSGRRFTSDMKFAEKMGLISKTPHYNSIFNHMNTDEMTAILKELIELSSLPLKSVETDFAVDTSGFSANSFSRWFSFKHGRDKTIKAWVKAHLIVGVKTNIVTAVEITEGKVSDTVMLPDLVTRTSKNFTIGTVSADKGYSSRGNYNAIGKVGGVGYIPFKSNASGKSRGSFLWKKAYHYFMYNREAFMEHYHKRSNVETAFFMIKSKFGNSLKSKKYRSQVNEVLCKVLCHNLCVVIQEMHELGIIPNFDSVTL